MWRAFDRIVAEARRKLAAYYYAAALDYSYSIGGFWWHFVDEMPSDPLLRSAVRNVVDQIAGLRLSSNRWRAQELIHDAFKGKTSQRRAE